MGVPGKVKGAGHFSTGYKNIDALKFHFNQQLDKLAENGFIELIDQWQKGTPSEKEKVQYRYLGNDLTEVNAWRNSGGRPFDVIVIGWELSVLPSPSTSGFVRSKPAVGWNTGR